MSDRYRLAWLSARRRASFAQKAFYAEARAARELEAARPTRDQIAEALHAHDQKRALVPRMWAKASELTKHTYLAYADAVLALLNGGESNG